jgi:LuxR family maltose regulon positive regulatory protein
MAGAPRSLPFRPLESKLHPPRSTLPSVRRSALLEALHASSQPLVLVCALAGAGKTTLLSQWSAEESMPTAWLQLDGGDNDPVRLLVYLVMALDRVTTLEADLLGLLASPVPPIRDFVLPSLVAAAAQSPPCLLVLDDAHLVTSEPSWQVIATLGAALPEDAHLAIGSRSEPQLPLGRLRAAGQIAELGSRDLAFDRSEVEEMLALHGAGDGATAGAVLESTEGWATGVYLSALSRAAWPDAAVPARLRFGRREVEQYFSVEVLDRQPRDVQEFLLCTSILYRMCPDLCRAITGREDSAGMLDRLAGDNLFLWSLDDQGQWFRYHHIFEQFLCDELRRRFPGREPELRRRAAAWWLAAGNVDRAVFHWLAAGDVDAAADCVAAAWPRFVLRGQVLTVGAWLGLFSHEQILHHPALALTAGWYYAISGDLEMGALWRHVALLDEVDGPSPDGAASLCSSRAMLRATLGWGGTAQMLKDAELAASLETRPGSSWHATANVLLGSALYLAGKPRRAVRPLRAAVDESGADYVLVEMGALGMLTLIAADEGDWRKAREYSDRAAERFGEARLGEFCPSAVVHATRARVLAEEGDAGVLGELARAHHVLEHMVDWPRSTLIAAVVAGEACLRVDRPLDAALWSARAQEELQDWPDDGVLRARVEALRVAVELRRGMEPLSAAEERLVEFLPTQLSFVEIAAHLSLSTNTVKSHVRHIYAKLGVTSRTEAVERARELGLLGQ